ncbi:hypothetical protein L2E82_43325 [Cichorium intybus]|uniref:Uncharacterized protein n=1 Tax=Cichorium intybus TaxID=13427 RepID=A0ACB8ZNF5_CICIN|nr:hypothetical protein L2E82_43325 [Cichorium intybus]
MSNNIALKQARKDESQSSGGSGRKTSSLRPPEQTLKCPRCDSTNTKFCYYNNYNLTQPRHFCKTCRRYWTKGGALRNIPIGGGCRKNKKTKSSTSKFTIEDSSSNNGGLKLLDGLSPPVMDFQLGGINFPSRFNQFSSSYGDTSSNLPFMNLDPLGDNFALSTNVTKQGGHHNQSGGATANCQEMGFTYTNLHQNTSLASSIESLSSLNQDLHWKLQQQRLAMLFGGGAGGEHDHQRHQQKETGLQPILFQNLEISKPTAYSMGGASRKVGSSSGDGGVGVMATEWFFGDSYAPANVNPDSTENDQNGDINTWNRIQAWNHMNQYTALP